ncbi:MAG TPA: hypothetical protein VIY72_02195, partial [Acidimicrobiales bacterium]
MAGSETILGERPWTSRLPTVAATLASIGLLYAVARGAGIRPIAASFGTAVAFTSPMALLYGTMPDTPIFSLAFGAAILVLWQRAWLGTPAPRLLLLGTSVLAALSGWEAALLAATAAASLVLLGRSRSDRRRAGISMAIGVAAGTVGTVLWATWAYGSTSVLLDQMVRRSSGAGGMTPQLAVDNQL